MKIKITEVSKQELRKLGRERKNNGGGGFPYKMGTSSQINIISLGSGEGGKGWSTIQNAVKNPNSGN